MAAMPCAKLQQSLGSTSADAHNDGSRSDMTHTNEISGPNSDNTILSLARDIGKGPHLSPSLDHEYQAHPDITDNDAARVGKSGLLPSHSIFGVPSIKTSDDRAEIIPTSDSIVSCDGGSVFEGVIRVDTPMQPERCISLNTSTSPDHPQSARDSPEVDMRSVCSLNSEADTSIAKEYGVNVDDINGVVKTPEGDDQLVTTRLLRPQAGSKRGFTSTWVDQDDSGNYDPKADRQRMNAKRARRNAAGQKRPPQASGEKINEAEATESYIEDIEEPASDERSESNKGLVVLNFTTEEGIGSFETKLVGLAIQRAAQQSRRRSREQRDWDTLQDHRLDSERGARQSVDLKNKPIARCCWSCADLSGEQAAILKDGYADCSLATDATQWPCLACLDEGAECVLITEPVRKLACEDCKRHRVACSFTSTRNHGGPCQQCRSANRQCVAGPVKDAIIPRLEYKAVLKGGFPVLNTNKEPTYTCNAASRKRGGKQRRPADCVECSESRVECDYGNDGGACHECKRAGLACTIPDLSLLSSGSRLTGSPQPVLTPPKAVDVVDQVPPGDSSNHGSGPSGLMRTITTSFSHPIVFNCDNKEPRRPCHFCIQPALRFVGFGRKEASVIEFDDSSGFVEVSGGHREDLVEPTSLCAECTASRLTLVMCEAHAMAPIADLRYNSTDQERLCNSLLDDNIKNGDIDAFCSLCFDLATVKCSAPQEEGENGCGLKLCDLCTAVLVGRHDGDLGAMLVDEDIGSAQRHGTAARADVELLGNDGVLLKYLAYLSRQ